MKSRPLQGRSCHVREFEVSLKIARQSLSRAEESRFARSRGSISRLNAHKFAARRLLRAHSPGRLEASRAICQHH